MRVHVLFHVAFEGLGSIEPHLVERGHTLSSTAFYRDEPLPDLQTFDWLIVMGGPMGVHDEARHPWLADELVFIRACIDSGKRVLGICLGAQLIAKALGADVVPNPQREIGWFPITRVAAPEDSPLAAVFPETCEVFHWHGDTFALPDGALLLARSEACAHQGFIWKDRVVALQFHLETTFETARSLISHCGDELDGSRWVQPPARMLTHPERFGAINALMSRLLDALDELDLALEPNAAQAPDVESGGTGQPPADDSDARDF